MLFLSVTFSSDFLKDFSLNLGHALPLLLLLHEDHTCLPIDSIVLFLFLFAFFLDRSLCYGNILVLFLGVIGQNLLHVALTMEAKAFLQFIKLFTRASFNVHHLLPTRSLKHVNAIRSDRIECLVDASLFLLFGTTILATSIAERNGVLGDAKTLGIFHDVKMSLIVFIFIEALDRT